MMYSSIVVTNGRRPARPASRAPTIHLDKGRVIVFLPSLDMLRVLRTSLSSRTEIVVCNTRADLFATIDGVRAVLVDLTVSGGSSLGPLIVMLRESFPSPEAKQVAELFILTRCGVSACSVTGLHNVGPHVEREMARGEFATMVDSLLPPSGGRIPPAIRKMLRVVLEDTGCCLPHICCRPRAARWRMRRSGSGSLARLRFETPCDATPCVSLAKFERSASGASA